MPQNKFDLESVFVYYKTFLDAEDQKFTVFAISELNEESKTDPKNYLLIFATCFKNDRKSYS